MASSELFKLSTLKEGDYLGVEAGEKPGAFRYDFFVINPGEMPDCLLTQTDPDGKIVGPAKVMLEGAGSYLTRAQNPCQEREGQITIARGMMYVGGSVLVIVPGDRLPNRLELMPKCTAIKVSARE